ncbi:MAG TPA: class 1 fructose-bisphosphatase [Candidatus Krumholzibacteria bacterium]|nr:class 1 fructose-bisphosphatase [Candidatus Krumholzibacteria bacterium]
MTFLKGMTLSRFIVECQQRYPEATGEFTSLLLELTIAAKVISRAVNKAGLVDILGQAGRINVQDEQVMKIDDFANDTIVKALDHTGHLCIMASEEMADPILIPQHHRKGPYVFLFDPLDGSSNIDANVNIGTIFGIHRKTSAGEDGTLGDLLQKGRSMVCAGYIVYGPSTMLVYTTGHGVHGFTLDPSVGEFLLSHPEIQLPKRGKIYSANEGNSHYWASGVRSYLEHIKGTPDGRPPYSSRYVGSLVADFHRTLLYGGIFMYPADSKEAKAQHGKLRLLYEANPLAFVAEQAGGAATDGITPILDLEPQDLHQRTPLFIGSSDDVATLLQFLRGERS